MSSIHKRGLFHSAFWMALGTFLSRLLGLVREQVFAFLFGAGWAVDAFQVAFRIPNLLRDLFAEGAMSAALVPVFTRVRLEQGEQRAWRVAHLMFSVLFLSVSGLSFIGFLLAPDLVALYAQEFMNRPNQFVLAVKMTKILFPFFPAVSLAAALMAVLNACGFFFIPAFASALFNLFSILSGSCLAYHWTFFHFLHPIEGMAWGVLVGGIVQAGCQVPVLVKAGYRWMSRLKDPKWSLWYQDSDLKKILKLMFPGFLGLAATQFNLLFNTIFATSLGSGSISWLNYAFRLIQFPIGLFGVSLASATVAEASKHWVHKDFQALNHSLSGSWNALFILNGISSCFLIFLPEAIVSFLFEYGNFSMTDTAQTALALRMYGMGLLAYSLVKVFVPLFYVWGATQIGVWSSISAVILSVMFNGWAVPFFSLGHGGLALGTALGSWLQCVILLLSLRKILKKEKINLPWLSWIIHALKCVGVSIGVGVTCRLSWRHGGLLSFMGDSLPVIQRGWCLGVLFFQGLLLWVAVAYCLRIQGISQLFHFFLKKLKNKLRLGQT